jgi:hypothetical protein
MLLDAMNEVERWTAATTPVRVPGTKPFEFTPDFVVYESIGSYAVRLLRAEPTAESRTLKLHASACDFYKSRGQSLVVMTAAQLAEHPLLPAAKSLFIHRVREWPAQLPSELADRWSGECPTTLGAIHASLGGDGNSWLQLISLVAHGFVQIDLGYGIGTQTPVTACRHKGYRNGR